MGETWTVVRLERPLQLRRSMVGTNSVGNMIGYDPAQPRLRTMLSLQGYDQDLVQLQQNPQ
ncbi:hypothetical protein [Thiocapsa sp. UBA6158]|uniref:hypothetical protein n=1 Tax=Thiocapsa sp. UBA6158 TaxID=1947692 RepID=UPI0025D6FDA9|nr:hypothetical protein [Thiocapsa sp. UBA6158]